MSNIDFNDHKFLLFMVSIFVLLTISLINIKNITSTKEVLGAEIQEDPGVTFWNNFMDKNPNYIPGLIETGRRDKAFLIDPNYEVLNK